jgi:hypothetical protein
MLLSVPVAAVHVHEHGAEHAHHHMMLPPQSSTPPCSSSGGGAASAPSSHQHQHHHHQQQPNPARRVLRVLLSVTRQRPQQQRSRAAAHRPGLPQRAVAAAAVAAAAAPMPAASASAAAPDAPAAAPQHLAPLLLHSAASLPPPSPPKPDERQPSHHHHHHHRRRARVEHESEPEAEAPPAAGSAVAAAAASPPTPTKKNHNNNPLRALLRFVLHHSHRAARAARPQGPGCNDATPLERAVNVLTSLPFVAVGAHILRTRRAPAARRFGRSFLAVGLVAGTYHACPRGHNLRRPLRMLDYYSIAWSSSLLREAVGVKLPRWAAAAAAAATPIKPTAVTAGNLAVIELAYARAAWASPRMREAWRRHVGTAGVGIACFLAEDVVVTSGKVRFNAFHGVWHLLSACALGLANALLGHVEQALLLEAAEVVAEGEI